jgi:hypothetical protein
MAAFASQRWMILAAGLTLALPAQAFDWNEVLKGVINKPASTPATSGVDALSSTDINAGLKEALTRQALDRLYTVIGENRDRDPGQPHAGRQRATEKGLWCSPYPMMAESATPRLRKPRPLPEETGGPPLFTRERPGLFFSSL